MRNFQVFSPWKVFFVSTSQNIACRYSGVVQNFKHSVCDPFGNGEEDGALDNVEPLRFAKIDCAITICRIQDLSLASRSGSLLMNSSDEVFLAKQVEDFQLEGLEQVFLYHRDGTLTQWTAVPDRANYAFHVRMVDPQPCHPPHLESVAISD